MPWDMSYFSLGQEACPNISLPEPPGKDCMTVGSWETETVGLRGRAGIPPSSALVGGDAARPSAPASLFAHQQGPTGGDQTEGKRSRHSRGDQGITSLQEEKRGRLAFSDGEGLNVTRCCSRDNEDLQVAHLKEEVGGQHPPNHAGVPHSDL